MSGASGVKFVSELRETGVKTPIIIISALSQKDNMEIALDIGASDYIVKPISLKILKTSLGKYLD
jgi:DNA-binding response OmpR family regulator